MAAKTSTDIIEIKKYSNRRLYDTSKSSYVTLQDVAQMIRDGHEIRVVDVKTKEDLTRLTMLQIICESKEEQEALPVHFLRRVIQAGNKTLRASIREYLSMGLKTQREVQRQVTDLVRLGLAMNPFLVPFMPRKNATPEPAPEKKAKPSPAPVDEEVSAPTAVVPEPEVYPEEMDEMALLRAQLAMLQQKMEQLENKSEGQ